MKEVIIRVPDPKFEFFIELMEKLGFEVSQKYEVPVDQQNLVMDRIAKAEDDPGRLKNWDSLLNGK